MAGPSILIVEDECIIAADLAIRLRRSGYHVSAMVRRGDEAIAIARDSRPDLVLMDIRLQGEIDGIAAAQAIRRSSDVPILLLTAHSDPTTIQRAADAGPFELILKPFDGRELRERIEVALGQCAVGDLLRDG